MRDKSRSQKPFNTAKRAELYLRVMRDQWPVLSKGVARPDLLIRTTLGATGERQGSDQQGCQSGGRRANSGAK